jgi:hypothetical protein
MIDTLFKQIQGWIKIKGGTDGTFIGNEDTDRLKVKTKNEDQILTKLNENQVKFDEIISSLTKATTPTIFNVSVASANTEVSQLLPDNTNKFLIRVRDNANLKFSFQQNQSGAIFISVPRGSSYSESGLSLVNKTIYFQLDSPNKEVEIITWGL